MAKPRMPEIIRAPEAYYRKFNLAPNVKRWLDADDLPDDEDDDDEDDGTPNDPKEWDRWAMANMVIGPLIDFGSLLVDAGMLSQRFSCVSDRCSPVHGKGVWHSCCADAEVALVKTEANRLAKYRPILAEYLPPRELRLRPIIAKHGGKSPSFYLDEWQANLCRPGERCVFSKIDGKGHIRCHLWSVALELGVDRSEFQPYTCRAFPLSVIQMERGRTILGTLNRKNYRHMGGESPKLYPCLSDPTLPPIYKSMAADLDWMIGPGFADVLAELAKTYATDKPKPRARPRRRSKPAGRAGARA